MIIGSISEDKSLEKRISITPEISGKTVSVVVNKKYAPYIEFGTGSTVSLDDMLQLGIPSGYAMQFKGKGIREVNLPARPFLFSSARKELRSVTGSLTLAATVLV